MRVTSKDRFSAGLQIFAVFFGLLLVSALIGLLIAPAVPEDLVMPVQALGMWGAILAGALLLRGEGSSWRALGLRRPESWRRTLVWAGVAVLLSYAGAGAIGAAIQSLTDWPPVDIGYIRESIHGNLVAYVAWMILVVWGTAAFGEELLARGFVMDRLETMFGRGRAALVIAAILQAAIFGLLHTIQGPAGIFVTGYVGLVFAVAYFATGRNLWAPILAHGTVDTISLTLLFLGIPLGGHIE